MGYQGISTGDTDLRRHNGFSRIQKWGNSRSHLRAEGLNHGMGCNWVADIFQQTLLGGELPTDRVGGLQTTLVISMGFLWGQVVHKNNWGELTHQHDSWDEPPSRDL